MAKTLDCIVVIDVECTCWDGHPPDGQENEIIEVGLSLVDVVTTERSGKRSIIVKPERSKVSPFCTKLTSLTEEQVERGISFSEVCSILKHEYLTKDRLWASYGDYDRRQFERQCDARAIPYPFGPSHLNVKNLFAVVNCLPHEVGMPEALQLLQLSLEGTHHRGEDDAWNIAGILSTLLTRWRERSVRQG